MNGYFTEAGINKELGRDIGRSSNNGKADNEMTSEGCGSCHAAVKDSPAKQANGNNDQKIDNVREGPTHKTGPRSTNQSKDFRCLYRNVKKCYIFPMHCLTGIISSSSKNPSANRQADNNNDQTAQGSFHCYLSQICSAYFITLLTESLTINFLTDNSDRNSDNIDMNSNKMEWTRDSIGNSNTKMDSSGSSSASSFYSADSEEHDPEDEIYAVALGWRKPRPIHPPEWKLVVRPRPGINPHPLDPRGRNPLPVSYTHLTLPTTPHV